MHLFERISAPVKKVVWFEHSAHFVFLEKPSQFAAEMRRLVQETNSLNSGNVIETHEQAGDFKQW